MTGERMSKNCPVEEVAIQQTFKSHPSPACAEEESFLESYKLLSKVLF